MNEPYYTFNSFLKNKFPGLKIRKIPINAGFHCPNKDGTLSSKGCIFCDQFGSGPVKTEKSKIKEQIEDFIKNHPGINYLAYYQAHTNTYAPIEELREKYKIIFSYKNIVGLFIGTRPDSIEPAVYPMLKELNQKTYICVELGLQSIHGKSLSILNRNHTYTQFLDTFFSLKKSKIDTVIHLIVGIPGETNSDMLETVKEMNHLKPEGVKFHLMHVLKNTILHQQFKKKQFRPMSSDQYIDTIVCLLEHLDPSIVIHRITGERERGLFVAPKWALKKMSIINAIKFKMINHNTFQGKKLS